MKEYEPCECGSTETYISFSQETCCSPCFKALKEKVIIPDDPTAYVIPDDNGWAVKVRGEVMRYFSKYEDYACTEAKAFARSLNLAT